jgi:hypothetical protein
MPMQEVKMGIKNLEVCSYYILIERLLGAK